MNLMDQTFDIRAAISYLQGEPEVDPERIGLFGSSYGGGLVTLMAAIDPRVKCVAAQVGGLGIGPAADKPGYDLLRKQARGETEPVPIETGKLGGKLSRYDQMRRNPARNVGFGEKDEVVGRIRIPMIFIDAENEELLNIKENGEKFASILKANGVPVEYHVIKGISHYGIYGEGFEEATKLELAWFNKHLKRETASATSNAEPTKQTVQLAKSEGTPTQDAETQRRLEPAFKILDANADGKLTRTEFDSIKVGQKYFREHPEAVEPAFARLDADGNGALSFDEYRKIVERRSKQGEGQPAKPGTPQAPPATSQRAATTSAEDIAFFEKHVRPLLVSKCYECHSAEAKEPKGGLTLDTREGLRRGGESGPAVVPGNVAASLLVAALRHEDGLEMPPKDKLTDQQIATVVRWIEMGARNRATPWQRLPKKRDTSEDRDFWAFQPPRQTPVPVVKNSTWALTDVDRFLSAAQEKAGLAPVGDADPQALVRRLYFDLTGLPPTPAEAETFVGLWQAGPQQALEQTTDRLLASPRFGERWGRHWLDVARYAESSGKEVNFSYPQAWRYRDYIIDSLNADVPFDRLIREQIAGDLLPADDDEQRAERMIATGFLVLGPKSHGERKKMQFEMDLVDEQIDTVTQAFMGLTVACARCHDHKFDPIPQADYYALAGIFRSTETCYGTIPVAQNGNPSTLLALPANVQLPAGIPPTSAAESARLKKQVDDLTAKRAKLIRERNFGVAGGFLQTSNLLATSKSKVEAYHADGTPLLLAMGVRDRASPRNSPLYVRGEVEKPGKKFRAALSKFCGTKHRRQALVRAAVVWSWPSGLPRVTIR